MSKYVDSNDGFVPANFEQGTAATPGLYGDFRHRRTKLGAVLGVQGRNFSNVDYDYDDPYLKNFRRTQSTLILGIHITDLQNIAVLTVLAIFVRLFRISQPTSVVFDEVHFGGFATKYIKGRFFMDVHPPLAKLLITLAALIAGFDGHFDFKEIGLDYVENNVPYVAMRLMPGILGVLLIPISYLTVKQAGFTTYAAFLAATLLIFENGLITQSRHILLDSPLLFFTALTVLMWTNFHNYQKVPFTFWWWFWMAMTGTGLGLTASVKWVGLFTIALIGFSTIKGLWELLGDLRISPIVWAKHFFARALCLIVIPVLIYMFFFVIHFAILHNSGDGDGFMSSEFQQTLSGHGMSDTPADIAYGATVTIRHVNTQGGYLHSHNSVYPGGSKQQQITLYPHKDDNNLWIMKKEVDPAVLYNESEPVWVKNGDVVKLEHVSTGKSLHSHDIRPPVTDVEYQNEVSGYGFPGFKGDANDLWRVEITEHEKSDSESRTRLRTLRSKFRLVHVMQNCALMSHKVKLPEWGFEQQEVTCVKGGIYPNTVWYIETNSHPTLPKNAEMVNYKRPGFLKRFLELNKVMWTTNAGLTDSHPYESRPFSWPALKRGINFWGKDHRQIYLIGNPLIWWGTTAAIWLYIVIKIIIILRAKRGYLDHLNATKNFYESHADFFFVGWVLHFFPFLLMARQLFLHHYFPALYFGVLLLAEGYDLFTSRLPLNNRRAILVVVLLLAIYVYSIFSPLSYANMWTKKECNSAKWLSTWDFDCNTYYDTYDEYSNPPPVQFISVTPSPAIANDRIEADSMAIPPQGHQEDRSRDEENHKQRFKAKIAMNDPKIFESSAIPEEIQAEHKNVEQPQVENTREEHATENASTVDAVSEHEHPDIVSGKQSAADIESSPSVIADYEDEPKVDEQRATSVAEKPTHVEMDAI